MILQALYDYYHRKAAQDSESIAPLGFQYKEIPFLIVIDENGKFIQLEDTREGEGKKKRAKSYLVPQEVKRTSGVSANLLWDKPDYVLAYAVENQKMEKLEKAHAAFVDKIKLLKALCASTVALEAVLSFLEAAGSEGVQSQIITDPVWAEIVANQNSFLSFRLKGKPYSVCEDPEVFSLLQDYIQGQAMDDSGQLSVCLVSGQQDKIELTHPSIKGVLGGQTSGVNIVSFNLDAACSFGKKQGENAPIGHKTAIAYTSALNLLLGKDSRQKLQLSGTCVVFWAERESEQASLLEDRFADLFSDDKDNPDLGVEAVNVMYLNPWTGINGSTISSDNRFFVLGLSPNAARVSIRFFHVLSLEGLFQNIRQHFEDLAICHSPKERAILPLRQLIRQLCLQGDLKNAPPNLEGAFFESVVVGAPYPLSILQAVVRRIRAEQAGEYSSVNYARAALLKGFLNRWYRKEQSGKEFTVSLDEANAGVGYCLGRLFALLEKIQEDASGISTVRERFYGSASSTPAVAFPQLLKLKNHHLAKMDSHGKVVYFEKLLANVMSHVKEGFPTHLSLFEQGAFSVGYYHQRQALFQKKDKAEGDALQEEQPVLTV